MEQSGWAEKYRKEAGERKRLHNLVLELKGNIRVFCRVRPKLPHEGDGEGCVNAVFFPDDRPDLEEHSIAVRAPPEARRVGPAGWVGWARRV
jgi:kinesin family protein C1